MCVRLCIDVEQDADGALLQDLTAFELKLGLDPVLVPIAPNTDALLSGVASRAIPALVQLAMTRGFSGYVCDYEPHANLTLAHAQHVRLFPATCNRGLLSLSFEFTPCIVRTSLALL